MFLTESEHSKMVENFSNAFEKHQSNYADTYDPKVLFSPCDLGPAATRLEREIGTAHWICSPDGLTALTLGI